MEKDPPPNSHWLNGKFVGKGARLSWVSVWMPMVLHEGKELKQVIGNVFKLKKFTQKKSSPWKCEKHLIEV